MSKEEDIKRLAEKTLEKFGRVDLLINNAGVASGLFNIWESTLADWKWTFDVNLFGVVHGVRTFVPIMLKQDTEAHILNVASVAGMMSYYFNAPYHVSKCAVVALSEQLYFSLALQNSKIKTSVLCPGYTKTKILESERNRPVTLLNINNKPEITPQIAEIIEQVKTSIDNGTSPEELAEYVFDAIKKDTFYILTHHELDEVVNKRCEDILNRQNPDVMATIGLLSNPVSQ